MLVVYLLLFLLGQNGLFLALASEIYRLECKAKCYLNSETSLVSSHMVLSHVANSFILLS